MIRIRRILSAVHREAVLGQVEQIFRDNFGAVADYAGRIPALLDEPFTQGYRAILLVAERELGQVAGFSLILHFPEIRSSYLDFIAVSRSIRGGGVGSALFEGTREFCRSVRSRGLYLEAPPDEPAVVGDAKELAENRKRLRFYEHYGIRPVIGTAYETPIGDDTSGPHLLFDGLGRKGTLGRREVRTAVRLILERKYGHIADRAYINKVVASFRDDPVRFRNYRYVTSQPGNTVATGRMEGAFALVVGRRYDLHHMKDRGYVERPARARVLVEALGRSNLFHKVPARHVGDAPLRTVHAPDFVAYVKRACEKLGSTRPVYPYVFPIRRPERKPKEMAVRAGYYCIDTFTPLYPQAYEAARHAVDVALTGADRLLAGCPVTYALCRPPGHHAERRVYGGFCYFNNAAIAAERLSRVGPVAVLDIDYHHGNGTQDIFYRRSDVFVCSIHGHPNFAYPYFSGFADERGEEAGRGYNRNVPLPEDCDERRYLDALDRALEPIVRFRPAALVVSLGFDIMKGDPTGTFSLSARSMEQIGRRLGALGMPLLLVQEGGYTLRNLRQGAPALFKGIAQAVL